MSARITDAEITGPARHPLPTSSTPAKIELVIKSSLYIIESIPKYNKKEKSILDMVKKKLRVAVIGLGYLGKYHLEKYLKNRNELLNG